VNYYVNKHIKLNIMAYRTANNSSNIPFSKWHGTKDPAGEFETYTSKRSYFQ
jgi:hypothetical protein